MLLTFLLHYLTLVPHIVANVLNIEKLIKRLVLLAPYKMQFVTVYGKKDLLVMLVIQQRFFYRKYTYACNLRVTMCF